jgi:hypothetical protein
VAVADTGIRPPLRSTAMTRRIIRTATTAIAIAALAAPTALARPDAPPAAAKINAAATRTQDVRSADTDSYPTRPVLDRPSAPPTARPEITPKPVADDGTPWTTIAIAIVGSLLAIGAIAGITSRTRRTGRPRITA